MKLEKYKRRQRALDKRLKKAREGKFVHVSKQYRITPTGEVFTAPGITFIRSGIYHDKGYDAKVPR